MVGIYFSGTGNSRYCVEKFLEEYEPQAEAFSIENENAALEIGRQDEIVLGYPVQFSSIPKILKDYVISNHEIWKGKRVFIIATMGLFSGDGAGIMARLLKRYGAVITGGLHVKMPDSIGDERALKRPLEKHRELVVNAGSKIKKAAAALKCGEPPREGLGVLWHLAGLFGQRLYFFYKTKEYTDKLKIDAGRCIGCGMCANLCPMENIQVKDKTAVPGKRCTMCYRCINQCPAQAITLLGKRVVEQCDIKNYL